MGRRVSAIGAAALILVGAACAASGPACDSTHAAQGWTDDQRASWYTASQGSRLIPRTWLDALEQPGNQAPFLDPAYVGSFRYLLRDPGQGAISTDACPYDPALPLGFAVDCHSDAQFVTTRLRWKADQSDREPWVGMNCAACHTAELTYRGTVLRVDGGPTLADFQSFTEALSRAVKETDGDSDKFERFAAKIPGADADQLHAALQQWIAWNDALDRLNDPGGLRYGFGRLDAIGHIFNKVALAAMADTPAQQRANPADAPVSYPFLWNVPQLDRVEWNGIAPNSSIGNPTAHGFDFGGLGRNTGEAIGVFADLVLAPQPHLDGYLSSVDVKALVEIENQLGWLRPPTWPAAFPPIDAAMASSGAALFKQRCAGCHAVPAIPVDLKEHYTTTLSPLFSGSDRAGTDIWMACNAVMDRAGTGALRGNSIDFVSPKGFGEDSDNFTLLSHVVEGALLKQKVQVVGSGVQDLFGLGPGLPPPRPPSTFAAHVVVSAKQKRHDDCQAFVEPDPQHPKLAYKGRPLQGIWATAPFLHNGSVPTLYDLLLPPAQRPTRFFVGSREFDPVRVGIVTAAAPDNTFAFDTLLDGNANTGHDYGNAGLTDDQRRALVEYMKTL